MSLGRSAEEWTGTLAGDVVGDHWSLLLTHSNIDDNAPDGLAGATEIEVEVRIE